MKNIFLILLFLLGIFYSCKQSDSANNQNKNSQTIITNDSSGSTGKLIVRVFDFSTGNTVSNADVFIYTRYEDIQRNIYLNTLKTQSNGQVNFGFLLSGNYYLRATNGFKADTGIAQVITANTVTKNIFLK